MIGAAPNMFEEHCDRIRNVFEGWYRDGSGDVLERWHALEESRRE
jgi:hypothetical protein